MADELGASDLRGGCFRGALRLEAREIVDMSHCHCSIYRRFSGAPPVAWANLPACSFRITRDSPKGFASSERWVRHFCPACGCPVFGRHTHPSAHVWRSARMPWFDTSDDLPRFPEGEPSPLDTGRGERR